MNAFWTTPSKTLRMSLLMATISLIASGTPARAKEEPLNIIRYFVLHVMPGTRNPTFEILTRDRTVPGSPTIQHRFPLTASGPHLFVRLTRVPSDGAFPEYRFEHEPLDRNGKLYREMLDQLKFTFVTYENRGTAPSEDISKMIEKELRLDPLRSSVVLFANRQGEPQFIIRAFDGAPQASPVFLGPFRQSRLRADGYAETLYGNAFYGADTSPPTMLPFQESHPYFHFPSVDEPRIEIGRAARSRGIRDHLPSILSQVREFLASTQFRYDSRGNFGVPANGGVYAEATGVAVKTYLSELSHSAGKLRIVSGNLSRQEVALYRPELLESLAPDYQHPPALPVEPRAEMEVRLAQRFVIRQPMTEFFDIHHYQFEGALPLRCEALVGLPQWMELMAAGAGS